MEYNLLKTSFIESNTDVGNVSLSPFSISLLIEEGLYTSLFGDDILCIDCDLGYRVGLNKIKYTFLSDFEYSVVSSGIKFFVKDEYADDYSELLTCSGSGYFYATSSGTFSPRYVRLLHTVYGTSVSGTVVGMSVINDGSVIDFGSSGDVESVAVGMRLDSSYEITEIPIFNNGEYVADANVYIEKKGSEVDNLVSISSSEEGPWVSTSDYESIVSDDTYWDYGSYYHTSKTETSPSVVSVTDGFSTGTYTTRIFSRDSNENMPLLIINKDMVSDGTLISVDEDDTINTLEIRSSYTKPINYSIYREFYSPTTTSIAVRDYWRHTGTLKANYSAWSSSGGTHTIASFATAVDKNTGSSMSLLAYREGSIRKIYVIKYNYDLSVTSSIAMASSTAAMGNVYINGLELDGLGGVWGNIYVDTAGGSSYSFDVAGFYLFRVSSALSSVYKIFSAADATASYFSASPKVTSDNKGAAWYVNKSTNSVIKIDHDGNELAHYTNVDTVYNVCSTDDGGCWFVRDSDLVCIDEYGNDVYEFTDLYETSIRRVAVAYDGNVWLRVGTLIKKIEIPSGRELMSIEVVDADYIFPVQDGIWIRCIESEGEYYYRFLDESSYSISRSVSRNSYNQMLGVFDCDYTNSVFSAYFPTSIDSVWSSTDYRKVNLDNLFLPEETYHQARFTLRRSDGDVSPTLNSVCIQNGVSVTDIHKGSSKPVYLKTVVGDSSGVYNTNIKVMWSVPV